MKIIVTVENSGNCVSNCPESPIDISERLMTELTEISMLKVRKETNQRRKMWIKVLT